MTDEGRGEEMKGKKGELWHFPFLRGIQVHLGKCPAHAWLSVELGFVVQWDAVSSTASGNCSPMILLRMCSLVAKRNSSGQC